MNKKKYAHPASWVPTLYFAEAMPYVAIMAVTVIMYKRLGISNTDIALYTSWLYLPWVIKPLWSPFVDIIKTKRWWFLAMELFIGAGFAGVALTIPMPNFFQMSLALFWLLAFGSATHDIAADGFYMLGLKPHHQSFYVGIRSLFYRFGTLFGQGAMVWIAGLLESSLGNVPLAWSLTFYIMAGIFIAIWAYHRFIIPYPDSDHKKETAASVSGILADLGNVFVEFFKKKQILAALLFMLLFRLPEAQLVKISGLFLIDDVANGGLGLSTAEIGVVQGTVGVLGIILGGILGGMVVSRHGLKRWLWPMVAAISLPDLVYVYLSITQTSNLWAIGSCLFVEQFGYGFGFSAYMLYLIYFSQGKNSTAHYALCTGFMALGMMLPGMLAGWMQEMLGYQNFFWWVVICCAATVAVCAFINVDSDFGKKVAKS